MRHKNTIRLILVAIVLTGSFLVLWSSPSLHRTVKAPESVDDCVKKQEPGGSLGWENLSHQFFSTF